MNNVCSLPESNPRPLDHQPIMLTSRVVNFVAAGVYLDLLLLALLLLVLVLVLVVMVLVLQRVVVTSVFVVVLVLVFIPEEMTVLWCY